MVSGARVIAAIGNFDGVHLGHRLLIARARDFAGRLGARTGAVVFDPHPRRFFRPDEPPFLLTTIPRRKALLHEAGVDEVMILSFDHALAAQSPEAFVSETLVRGLGLSGVVAGEEFRFGAGRSGDAQTLARLCERHGLDALIVPPLAASVDDGGAQKIGSSGVREALIAGDVVAAARMLGRPWRIDGVVESGRRLGRTLGFPTANLTLGPLVEPRRGVYAVRVGIDGEWREGVANFGRRPTVGAGPALLEVHIFDYAGDLYGREIAVDLIGFLRPEQRFDDLEALKHQIVQDGAAARAMLGRAAERESS